MKSAILIITYSSPKQTARLINTLNNGEFDFYIHLDKKIGIETHKDLLDTPNVYFVENRVDIKWAAFSNTEAILNGLKYIDGSGRKYSFISLVSGQDYPLKPALFISNFLNENVGKEFIHYRHFDEWTEAYARVHKYHFTEFKFPGQYFSERVLNTILPKRKFPLDIKLYGKETFWTLSHDCAMYVVEKIESNNKLKKFLKYTWGCDEFIFQSIIMNSPFKDRVVNNNLRFINWPVGKAARPNVFVTTDFERIKASDAIFGRKFDINTDEHILDLIDNKNLITIKN